MRQMRNYRDFLIEELADAKIEETLSYLQVSLEEYQKDGYGDVLYLAYETAIKAQGGAREFARKTHSNPQDVANAMSSKNETLISQVIEKLLEDRYEGSIYGEAKRLYFKDFISYKSMPVGNILPSINQKCHDEDITFSYANHSTGSSTLDSLDEMDHWELVRWDIEFAEKGQSEIQSNALRTKRNPQETIEGLIYALDKNRLPNRDVFSKELRIKGSQPKSYYLIEAV